LNLWIFTHGDGDGLCAGALALASHPDARVFFTNPYGLYEDLAQVGSQDAVIICDIALSESYLPKLLERFSTIDENGELIYIDHHPLSEAISRSDIPGEVIHALGSSASELTYSFFQTKLSLLQSRIAIYGAIADYLDNTPIIHQLLRKWDKRKIYFETGIIAQGIVGLKRDYGFKREIVSKLAENVSPSFHNELSKLALEHTQEEEEVLQELKRYIHVVGEVAYVLNVSFSLGKTALYARTLADALVGVSGEYRKDVVDMSLRTHEKYVDLNKILRRITPKFGGSGGGHPAAAGARIPKDKFVDFIEELNRALKDDS
jgi:RecJ-like exonuclease